MDGVLPSAVFLLLICCHTAAGQRQLYMVRTHNQLKPTAFPSVDHWYAATLLSLSDSLSSPTPVHVYRNVFHGFSVRLTHPEAEELATKIGVLAVLPDGSYRPQTTRSPCFLGLKSHSQRGLLTESDYGSGVVVGVFDTGITPERRSFDDHGLGPPPARWKGECEEGRGFSKANCNNKIVGARFFPYGYEAHVGMAVNDSSTEFRSPRDSNGHGTHTAATAAGRRVENASMYGYADGIASGIAPKARIAVYKICWTVGCFRSDIVAAFDKAVEDGVDIISLSISLGPVPFDVDPIAIAAFGAMEKGVLVSTSAGNDGPGTSTVGNLAPWITTVGAGTIDRRFPVDVQLGDGKVVTGTSVYGGGPPPPNHLTPLVYAGDVTVDGTTPFCMYGTLDPTKVQGKIVMCESGGAIDKNQKAMTVKDVGGVGMIIANQFHDGEGLIPDSLVLPSVNIGGKEGSDVRSYIARSRKPRASFRFRGTELGTKPSPMLASFSSRGPNLMTRYVIKPDVIAPGVGILATWTDLSSPTGVPSDQRKVEFNIMTGTSMSCPHVSGIAALLRGAHPDWSPAAIKSALMTTAYKEDGERNNLIDESTAAAASPWGIGSGHVDPERAYHPGLVYDVDADDYIDFLCGSSNYTSESVRNIARRDVNCTSRARNPWDLNYPSISVVLDQSRPGKMEVVVRRTVTKVDDGASTYKVSVVMPKGATTVVEPPEMAFGGIRDKKEFKVKITAERTELEEGGWSCSFGEVAWSDGRHLVRTPVAVARWQP